MEGLDASSQKALNLRRASEFIPVQMRILRRTAELGKLLLADIVSGDGPPNDGLAGEESAQERLAIAVPENLAKQHTPGAAHDDAPEDNSKAEVEPDHGVGVRPDFGAN